MVRYLPAPRLRQAGLTTNGKSTGYGSSPPFALRYRRVKRTFYEVITVVIGMIPALMALRHNRIANTE